MRPPSTDSSLANLALSVGALDQEFSNALLSYTATVPNSLATIRLRSTATSAFSVIRVNSVVTASGAESSDISLAVGQNVITVVVTSEDGSSTRNFNVTVTRS
jgi:hypothetical protein